MLARIFGTFRIFFSRAALLSAIVLTVWLPACLLMAILEYTGGLEPGASNQVQAFAGLLAPITVGALIFALARIRAGEDARYREAMRTGLRCWSQLLVSRFLANVLIALGYLAFIVPGILLHIRYSLLEASLVMEDAGVVRSRQRSWQLSRGMTWNIFAACLVLGFLLFVTIVVTSLLVTALEPSLPVLMTTLGYCVPKVFGVLFVILLFGFYLEGISTEGPEGAASLDRATAGNRRLHLALIPLVVLVSFVPAFRSAIADWNDVPTGAMKPTILPGDRILLSKSAFDLRVPFTTRRVAQFESPRVGDVVLMLSPADGRRLVKRVVGIPGDTIEFRDDHRLYRNGTPATYSETSGSASFDRSSHPMVRVLRERLGGREYLIQVISGSRLYPGKIPRNCLAEEDQAAVQARWLCVLGEGEHFVLGDNRNNSRDSRYFGPVERSAILGRATAVVLSFDRENFFMPRWRRFFTALH